MEADSIPSRLSRFDQAHADRVGVLVGGARYFQAFREAVAAARERVYILAWDVHSEVPLIPEAEDDLGPAELGAFLRHRLDCNPALHIHLLCWDFAMVYATEREWRPLSKYFRDPPDRLHLRFDNALPLGASHHQKVVVVDDCLAFLGGFDLGLWRWDTNEHRPKDPRRRNPNGKTYPPFHDIQAVFTGEAAQLCGDLCRERWRRATGDSLPAPSERYRNAPEPPWPNHTEVLAEDVMLGLIRTQSAFDPYPEIRDNLDLTLEIIRDTRQFLYLENQYLSSPEITEAIAKRLREKDGPEVVLILTQNTNGWLEEGTLGVMRDRLLERLSKADHHKRLTVLYPEAVDPESGDRAQIYVHAKLLLADDRILKVGSCNLSNRSMKVDTEADIVLVEKAPHEGIRRLRHSLIAMHFNRPVKEVEDALKNAKTLREGLDQLADDNRNGLRPFQFGCRYDWQRALADRHLLDPDEPIDPGYWIQQHVPPPQRPSVMKRIAYFFLAAAALLGLGLLVKWGWGSVIDHEAVADAIKQVRGSPWTPFIVVLGFAFGATLAVPLNLLLIGATVALGPWWAFLYGLLGAHLGAIIGFGLGHRFGAPLLRRISSVNLDRISRKIGEHGAPSVALVRIVPVAPFFVVNLVAGMSELRFRAFLIGSICGMVPGMLAVVLLASRIEAVIRDPGWESILLLGGIVVIVAGAVFFIRKKLRSTAGQAQPTKQGSSSPEPQAAS